MEVLQYYSNQASDWSHLDRLEQVLATAAPRRRSRPGAPSRSRHKVDQRLNVDARADLVANYEAGAPAAELAVQHGLSKGSVLRLLRDAGVAVRRQPLAPDDLPEAIQLYESGLSLKAVGSHLGVSVDAVRNAFLRGGVAIRPRNGWRYDR